MRQVVVFIERDSCSDEVIEVCDRLDDEEKAVVAICSRCFSENVGKAVAGGDGGMESSSESESSSCDSSGDDVEWDGESVRVSAA